jgi:hypothetical protein
LHFAPDQCLRAKFQNRHNGVYNRRPFSARSRCSYRPDKSDIRR